MRLSDTIELFIKNMLADEMNEVELQRNDLASYFSCSPSQINYVLTTRFSPQHGYVITSKRGGGGCIRIARLHREAKDYVLYLLNDQIGQALSEQKAKLLVRQLQERGLISQKEAVLIAAAVDAKAISVPLSADIKDQLRAGLLKHMLMAAAAADTKEEDDDL